MSYLDDNHGKIQTLDREIRADPGHKTRFE